MTAGAILKSVFFSKALTFSGRASRREYWIAFLVYFLTLIIWAGLIVWFGASVSEAPDPKFPLMIASAVFSLMILYLTVPMLAVCVRRLHDQNRSGWWLPLACILCFLPYVGVLPVAIFLIFLTVAGTNGVNRFGADPIRGILDPEVFA